MLITSGPERTRGWIANPVMRMAARGGGGSGQLAGRRAGDGQP
jgi:hypothetical protein